MDLSVIENDPTEVKKYLQNFVPINYYRVLGDEYLHQVRATLMHTTSMAELYNPVYGGLINDLTVTVGNNYATVNTRIDVQVDAFSTLAIKTVTLEVQAANANASIVEIQQASASQNQAQANINQRLEASLDDIVVGGRNIMKNSDFSKGYRAWQEASITVHEHYIGTMHKVAATGIVGSLMGIYPLAEYQNMAMVEGSQYSISFYAYGSITLMDEIYLTSPSGAPIKLPSVVISTDLTDRRHITFTAPTGGGGLGIILGATVSSLNDWFSISRVKVELGNKPTDWSPAPEDTEGYIAAVQSSIDTFKEVQVTRNLATAQSLELLDSRVETNAASILTERNTRVDQYSALSEVTIELEAKTAENTASINSVDRAYAEKFSANASRLTTLEADTGLSNAKIVTLEETSSNLEGAIASTSTTLTAKIDAVNVGGRNLLRNADFKLGVDVWGTATIVDSVNILGNLLTVTNTGNTTNYFGLIPVSIFNTISLISGKEYVLSFYARGDITSINDIWIKADGKLPLKLADVAITSILDARYEIVFIPPFTTETGSIVIGATGYPLNSWFEVVAVKLEQGNKATDWTAAPEDTAEAIINVEANINDFKGVQVTTNEATALRFTTMDTQLGESFGSIDDRFTVVSNDIGTNASKILELTSTTGANSSSIVNLSEAVSTNEGSIASTNERLTVEYIPKVEHLEANINNAVTQTDVQYYLSTSSVSPVGGTWETTAPPWTPSKYMFQRIETTYVDGLKKYTPSATGTNITGAKGDTGAQGIAGLEGIDGSDGIDGNNGIDGTSSYTHLAYGTSSTGGGFSVSHFTNATYIGMYVDSILTDSNDPTKYRWSLIKGADGSNGIAGTDGADGLTPYFHIAYANSADGVTGFSVIDSTNKGYIGQYTDNTLADSTNPSKYKWTLIRGSDGVDGLQGPKGDQGIQGMQGVEGPRGLTGLEGDKGDTGLPGTAGINGTSSYTHLAYGTSSTGANFSVSHFANATYIGMYVDNIAADSTTTTKYKWSLIKGADGTQGIAGPTGTNGQTSYLHIAYATSADGVTGFSTTVSNGKTYIGQYTDFTSADSNTPSLYSWSLIKGDKGDVGAQGLQGLQGPTGSTGIQGPVGANGLNAYTHIAYSTSATGATGFSTSNPTGATYIGMYADSTALDSETPSAYNWSLIKGADGAQGIAGPTGVNGLTSYLHIAYATNTTGTTGFSTTDSVSKTYIGQYTDTTLADSTDATKYSWSLIKGADGTSSYTHLAYGTSSTGAGFSVAHFASATYIGMYVDNILADSTTPSMYKWSLIKGADGAQGIAGSKGADGLTPYFHVAYATNASGTTGFSTTDSVSKTYIGQYTDNTAADSNTASMYSWTLIKGADGATGAVGQGITSITEQYAVSTSKTVAPTTWTTTMPTWSYGLYVWTRSAIVYKNPTATEYTQPLVDSSWEAVNNLNVGGRNLLKKSNIAVSNATYIFTRFDITEAPKVGEEFTLTLWGTLGSTRTAFKVYNSGSSVLLGTLSLISTGVYRLTGTWIKGAATDTYIQLYQFNDGDTSTSTVKAMKLERGNKGTDWTPAPEDASEAISATLDIANTVTNDFGLLKAESKVLTTVGTKVSGWKNLNNGTTSSFDILSDNFSVGSDTVTVKPFKVLGAVTYIENVKIKFGLIEDVVITNAMIGVAGIEFAKINNVIITDAHITNATIDYAKLKNINVTTAQIANAQIAFAKITGVSIDTAQIVDAAITSAKIADLSVSTAKIDDASITTAKIGTAQIDTLQIKGEAVTIPRLIYNPNGSLIAENGVMVNATLSTGSYLWAMSGNVYPVDIITHHIGSATFDAMGGSISIQLTIEDITLFAKPKTDYRIYMPLDVILLVRRGSFVLRKRLVINYTDLMVPVSGKEYKQAYISLPAILDVPPAGESEYIAELILYANRTSTENWRLMTNDFKFTIGTVSLQLTGVKR